MKVQLATVVAAAAFTMSSVWASAIPDVGMSPAGDSLAKRTSRVFSPGSISCHSSHAPPVASDCLDLVASYINADFIDDTIPFFNTGRRVSLEFNDCAVVTRYTASTQALVTFADMVSWAADAYDSCITIDQLHQSALQNANFEGQNWPKFCLCTAETIGDC